MSIQHFRNLKAWEKSHELVLFVYKITKKFPDDERFGMTSQARRAAISVTSNIAEGFGRNSKKDKVHFYTMSLTSLRELENLFITAGDLGYVTKRDVNEFFEKSTIAGKLLSGLSRSAVTKKS